MMNTNTIYRQGYGAFIAPFLPSPCGYSLNWGAVNFSPFTLGFSDTVNSQPDSIPFINCLFSSGCPSNISRLIMAIVLNSIKGMVFSWLSPNVFEKIWIAIKSKFYSTATVILKIFVVWICASVFSGEISKIFSCRITVTMSCICFFCLFGVVTSARCCSPNSKASAVGNNFISTRTQTIPFTFSGVCDDFKPTKSPAGYVYKFPKCGNWMRFYGVNYLWSHNVNVRKAHYVK